MLCQGNTGTVPGDYGFLKVPCRQERGVRRWSDGDEKERAACPAHFEAIQARYPVASPVRWLDFLRVAFDGIAADPVHETHSDDRSEGPSLDECPTCRRAFAAKVVFPEQNWEHPADAKWDGAA